MKLWLIGAGYMAACVVTVRLLIWLDVKNEGKSWHVDKYYPMTRGKNRRGVPGRGRRGRNDLDADCACGQHSGDYLVDLRTRGVRISAHATVDRRDMSFHGMQKGRCGFDIDSPLKKEWNGKPRVGVTGSGWRHTAGGWGGISQKKARRRNSAGFLLLHGNIADRP
jgi:hypothetical protein